MVREGSFLLTSRPTLVISCAFDVSHSDRCKVIAHRGFDLCFPDDESCGASFPVCLPSGCLLWENASSGPLPIFLKKKF